METLLLFLANALASGAIGHYVGKGLSKIDSSLPRLLGESQDIEKACEVIRRNGLELEILKFFDDVKEKVDNSSNGNVLNFNGTNDGGVVANVVHVRTLKRSVIVSAPQGTVSSSVNHRNYAKYLIDRYHEFKAADVGRENVKYPVFYSSIKREFGAKWDMVPLDRFYSLCFFIQNRIDKTILGRNRKAKGVKNYLPYEEYLAEHCS
ncbi:hypothetical protein [Pseudomonas sp. AA-38]|uniref:hypothetical protein n=1 Tax=Pseudomonas sp. AA-38 TaxID=3028807 RepID=UPI0023F9FD0B|nr:hypothetical protein [Pseudomonas sp. AA-38]